MLFAGPGLDDQPEEGVVAEGMMTRTSAMACANPVSSRSIRGRASTAGAAYGPYVGLETKDAHNLTRWVSQTLRFVLLRR